jgi:drug/metabolite transporter (DMT)-like permease
VRIGSVIQMLMLGSLWGSSYLFIKVAVDGLSPTMVVAVRLLFGAAMLMTVIAISRLSYPREPRTWAHLVLMATIGIVIPWTLISWGTQYIDSGLAAVLNSTTPFFTILFVVGAFRAERLTLPRLVGLILGFLGVAVLTGADLAEIRSASVQGQIAVLISSICYGLAFAYAKRFVRGDPIVLAGCQIALAFLIITPFALIFGNPMESEITLRIVGAVLALGLLTSGLAYILYYRLIRDVGATMASYATYLIPLVGLFLGWLVLNERLTLQSGVGVVLILAGLAVATALHRDPAPNSRETATSNVSTPAPSESSS